MAMTKAERAEMERLWADLAMARAMRWPSYPKPAPMTLEDIKANIVDGGVQYGRPQKVARGWFYNAYLSHSYPDVTQGCSTGFVHSTSGDVATTQNRGRMYARKVDALRAMRHDLTEFVASILAKVDQQIEEESE